MASCNKLDGIHHLLPGKGVTPDKFVEHKEDEKLSSCVGEATHLGKKEETIADISTEPNLLVVKEFSLPASELEQCVVPDGVGELLSERAGQLSSSLETVSIECQNEPQAVIGTKAAQEYSEELEGRPIIHDLVLKENDGAEVIGVSHETHEEASLKKSGNSLRLSLSTRLLILCMPHLSICVFIYLFIYLFSKEQCLAMVRHSHSLFHHRWRNLLVILAKKIRKTLQLA